MSFPCKICGLKSVEDVEAAAKAGAAYIGLNFFPKSPRSVGIAQAHKLALAVPVGLARVALTVNADNDLLDAITNGVPVDILQLHGGEPPERVQEVRARYGLPVMKAVGVADAKDLSALDLFGKVADMLLVDAKKPKHSELPGGNGLPFDWTLIAKRRWPVPWLLAGGLTPGNVAEAIAMTGAKQVDVSSGVESAPGVKEADRIVAFVKAASDVRPSPPKLRA